jgi:ATP-dependent Clp protease ATP-binding subunit ClpX
MSLVHYLEEQRRLYSDKIYIITNFYYAGEDSHLMDWKMLLEEYDKPVIFAWDELQNEFNSREYRKFPMRLVHELTQNRKGNGKQVVYTTQTFSAVDNNFRNLTTKVVDCRTYFGRLTSCRHYRREFYEARTESKSIDRKIKIKPILKVKFIQTDYLRSQYDTFQRLDYLKGLDYEGIRPEEA